MILTLFWSFIQLNINEYLKYNKMMLMRHLFPYTYLLSYWLMSYDSPQGVSCCDTIYSTLYIIYGGSIRLSLCICMSVCRCVFVSVYLCFHWFLSDNRSPLFVNRSSSNVLERWKISTSRSSKNFVMTAFTIKMARKKYWAKRDLSSREIVYVFYNGKS